jgi:phospholipid/cholesterol/gamma-HCH transport system substrate-binding protein
MAKKTEVEVKVGLLVLVGIGLIMASIIILGGTESAFTRKVPYVSHFGDIDGLIEGAKVVLGGVQVGTVEKITLDIGRHDILVRFSVAEEDASWVRKDATVMIATQGMLGDKFVSLFGGTTASPELPPGSEIPNAPSKDLTQFITSGDQLMHNLNSLAGNLDHVVKTFDYENRADTFFRGMAETSKHLSSATETLDKQLGDAKLASTMKRLDSILAKIDNGTGTLGALVNDPGLYDDAKAFVGGANQNRIVRNLVRQTIRDGDKADADKAKKEQPSQ